MSSGSPFSRLDPLLREFIYEKKWQVLKTIQEKTIPAILDRDEHLLIAAGTASGKTEACFFPIITVLRRERALRENPRAGVEVLYIGPLKALINDQFERLETTLRAADIPLWRWHGDVGKSHKQSLLEHPSGILQITPESLEALFLRQSGKIKSLFGGLRFIVIDEIHAFIGVERGAQLCCLLGRIAALASAGNNPRRIGLSATLGNYTGALAWLEAGTRRKAVLISDSNDSREGRSPQETRRLSLAVDFFRDEAPRPLSDEPGSAPRCSLPGKAGPINPGEAFYPAIYDQCRGDSRVPSRKCIIFTNSRAEAEETAEALKVIAAQRGEEDHFGVHHGSIAVALREETEKKLRETENAQTIAATATLELGIDIGRLDRIIQIGAPISAAAFVQRLGRSGRRSGVSQMYFCSRESLRSLSPSPLDKIPWTLLKTIAIIELYLDERWTEDGDPMPLPYSLLCHQTLSALASLGELDEGELFRLMLSLPPFREVDKGDYAEIIDGLEKMSYLERIEDGKLIVGLAGERVVNHYSFYSVFPEENEFRVTYRGKELGTINFVPPEGAGLILGGRNWKVEGFAPRNKEIRVVPGFESGARIWRGGGNSLHPKVARRMKQVLLENRLYPYLTKSAAARLWEGREYAGETGIDGGPFLHPENAASQSAGSKGNGPYAFFMLPWLGSRGMKALSLVLRKKENREGLGITALNQENPYAFRIGSKLPAERFSEALRNLASGLGDPETLVDPESVPFTGKFDYLLPPRLLVKQYAANMLDTAELGNL